MTTKELFSKFKNNFFRLPSIALFISGASVAVVFGSLYFTHKLSAQEQEVRQEEYVDDEPELSVGEEQADEFSPFAAPEDGKISTVFIGHGGAGHSGGTLADTIILFSIDPENKKAKLVSIPRDLWVALPTDYNNQTFNKINAAYAIGLDNVVYPNKRPEFRGDGGAAGLLKYAAYTVTGIQVDNYIAVDFGGFQSAIDQLGGLEVDVPHTFDDYFYPVKGLENEICGKSVQEIADLHAKFTGFQLEKQFECRYEHIHYAQGKAKMTGGDALKFVRSRHSANYGGDFARSQRQFAVLAAIYDKVLANNLITNTGALAKLTALVNTDIKTTDVKSIFSSLGNTSDYQVEEVHLSTDNVLVSGTGPAGQYILIPKAGVGQWEEVKDFVSSN